MKKIIPLPVIIILFAQGCSKDDNPTQPSYSPPSIEDQINAQRPLNSVVVYYGDPRTTQSKDVFLRQNPWDKDLLEANVHNGYLTVKSSFGIWNYDLSQANYIRLATNSVELDY